MPQAHRTGTAPVAQQSGLDRKTRRRIDHAASTLNEQQRRQGIPEHGPSQHLFPLGVELTSVFWGHCCWSLGVESRGNATRKFTRRDQELFGSSKGGVHVRHAPLPRRHEMDLRPSCKLMQRSIQCRNKQYRAKLIVR